MYTLSATALLLILGYIVYTMGGINGQADCTRQYVKKQEIVTGIVRQGYAMRNEHGHITTFLLANAEKSEDEANKLAKKISELTGMDLKVIELYYKEIKN